MENPTVWKSNNQGVKEETFIQTSRRGRDGQPGRENSWQGGSWWSRQSHIHMQINQEEQLGSETDPQPRAPEWGNKASNF